MPFNKLCLKDWLGVAVTTAELVARAVLLTDGPLAAWLIHADL